MRKPIQVNRQALEIAIQTAENENQFPTLSALWEDVAVRYNAAVKPVKPLKAGVVYLRVREWGIEVQTKPGKKGGDGSHLRGTNRGPRIPRADKFAKNPEVFEAIRARLTLNGAQRYLPLVEKIEKGSRSAAVKLHCLDCCAYQTAEVRRCSDPVCAMWLFRPYQGATEEDEQPVEQPEPTASEAA